MPIPITDKILADDTSLLRESLTWQISFTRAGASHTCADIIVPDAHFAPLLRSERVLVSLPQSHMMCSTGVLTNYVKELLAWWVNYLPVPSVTHPCPRLSMKCCLRGTIKGKQGQLLHLEGHAGLIYAGQPHQVAWIHAAMRSISGA